MYPTTYLEWWHDGAWHRIGWDAYTPESALDLRAHGARLARSKPGRYRLVQPSLYADAPPIVIHEYGGTWQCKFCTIEAQRVCDDGICQALASAQPGEHVKGANAEDCPSCDVSTLAYPFICPGAPLTPATFTT